MNSVTQRLRKEWPLGGVIKIAKNIPNAGVGLNI
jgi:hypothetical protein